MEKKGHYFKNNIKLLGARAYFFLVIIIAFSAPEIAFSIVSDDPEVKSVLKIARKFLDAEVRRDYPAVYACFAPSSVYARAHSFEQYRAQAKSSPERVLAYRIIRVSYILPPEDRQAHPSIEKVAQVEVDVTYLNMSTQLRSEVNVGFIFLKEGGRWYKS